MKKRIFFSKDLLNVMLVYVDKDTVKFDVDNLYCLSFVGFSSNRLMVGL